MPKTQDRPIVRSADISDCGMYRYSLQRDWSGGKDPEDARRMGFIMLNPSTADADVDDPTVRRCIAFARENKHNAIEVLNLYPFRATNPAVLRNHSDKLLVGDETSWSDNAAMIKGYWSVAVVAWGDLKVARHVDRAQHVLNELAAAGIDAQCLGVTKYLHPRHPLYVPGGTKLEPYSNRYIYKGD